MLRTLMTESSGKPLHASVLAPDTEWMGIGRNGHTIHHQQGAPDIAASESGRFQRGSREVPEASDASRTLHRTLS